MFKKILIANRGEIAIRVMRACKEMGITPVAVYSECDRTALHVSHAFESYLIGPSPSNESYLAIDKIIAAAKKSGADAIHPGYGFLAESPDFAQACLDNGLTFIGPNAQSIRLMGDKLKARKTMQASGIKVIPGSDAPVGSAEEAKSIANKLGYPVIIKAAMGGGGKGMRVVERDEEFEGSLAMTMGEAESSFGDGSVYIEKYIPRPRHIEVQILVDKHGNLVSLGERECSMQRRYQKVIEEAPSVVVKNKMRRDLSRTALEVAKAADYVGAGTVEFVMDERRELYFLEMNTRIQVEHPVTEMVYGCDIVKEQISIASGEKLKLKQQSIHPRGCAIEMRTYAEDPMHNFIPSIGKVTRLSLPQGPGVRNENGIYEGYEIPLYYDPLLGKIIVWAQERAEAIRRAKRALKEFQLDGVRTNVEFLLWILNEKGFIDGEYDTTYIERHFRPELLHKREEDLKLATIAASITAYKRIQEHTYDVESREENEAWKSASRLEGLRKPLL